MNTSALASYWQRIIIKRVKFSSEECGQTFTAKQSLQLHIKNRNFVSCKDCGAFLCTLNSLKRHRDQGRKKIGTAVPPVLRKVWAQWEGLGHINNYRSSVYFLGQNKPMESLIMYNKHPKVHNYQHNVCKYLKDQDYLIFVSKVSLGRLKMGVPGVRKINAFLQPCILCLKTRHT